MVSELTIVRPDDWHLHVRDGAALQAVVPHSARQFARAVIMPNLRPPVVDVGQALAYRRRILAAVPPGLDFEPHHPAVREPFAPFSPVEVEPLRRGRATARGPLRTQLRPALVGI